MVDQYLKPNVKRGAIYDAAIGIIVGIVMLIPVLNCLVAPLACVVGLGLPIVIGYFVAQWALTMPGTISTPLRLQSDSPFVTPAVDGAIATALGHLVSGVVVLIVNLLFRGFFATLGAVNNPEGAGGAAASFLLGGAFDAFGVIFGAVIAGLLGALGGILYVVLSTRQAPGMGPGGS